MPVSVAISVPYMGYVTIGICSFTIRLYLNFIFFLTHCCYRAQILLVLTSYAQKKNKKQNQVLISSKPVLTYTNPMLYLYRVR